MVGALVAGVLADRLGRRFTLVLASVIFVVGALLEALAPGTTVLVVGRLVLGAGSASPSVAGPLYGAENAAAGTAAGWSRSPDGRHHRHLLAYWADYLLIENDRWRLMLGISAVPAVLLVLVVLPARLRDVVRQGRSPYRRRGRRAQGRAEVDAPPSGSRTSSRDWPASSRRAGARSSADPAPAAHRRRGLVLQQPTGINAIIYYANTIFAAAGFDSPTQQSLATLWAVGG